MTVTFSLAGRSWELSDWATTGVCNVTEWSSGFGIGFVGAWLTVEYRALGVLLCGLVLVCHQIAWIEVSDDDGMTQFVAHTAIPAVAGALVFFGYYRIAAIALLADYMMYFRTPSVPDFAIEE